MNRLAIVVMVGALSASIGGAAQAQTLRPFSLDIGAAADIDSNSYGAPEADARPALLVGLGVDLPYRMVFRFEYAQPAWHEVNDVSSFPGSGGRTLIMSSRNKHKLDTYSFLVGRTFTVARRVHMTALGGFTAGIHRDRESETLEIRSSSNAILDERASSDSHVLGQHGLTLGFETAVS